MNFFEIWNLKSENFDENFENFRSNFFLKTNFSNRSKDKWPVGDGDTFIFGALSGQSNWGRSFSKIHKNLIEIPVWSDFARIGFWKCVTLAKFSFGRPNHFPRDFFFQSLLIYPRSSYRANGSFWIDGLAPVFRQQKFKNFWKSQNQRYLGQQKIVRT